ncbi:RNA-directed DNA polymerase, eukaryota [Tanacetum coccineum]
MFFTIPAFHEYLRRCRLIRPIRESESTMERERQTHHPLQTTTHQPLPHTTHQDDEDNRNDWKRVSRCKKKVTKQKDITISYFFTNFPNGWNDTMLWKTFAKYGRIIDVYGAKNKTRQMEKSLD